MAGVAVRSIMNDPVQAQYERWIYPEPIQDLADPRSSNIRDVGDPVFLGRAYWPDRGPREDLQILVAGCGPNAAARYAFHHPKAMVVGIDLSEASLAHAQHLKSKHHLDNLTLHQCRIEDVHKLGKTSFDMIESSGVLHHLPNPAAALKALANVLRQDGVVSLMLYAKYGRAGVYMAQNIFRILGLGQSPDDVAFVKTTLSAFHANHPVRQYLSISKDLHFDAGVVDTFLHPQDRAFTVAECLDLVDSAGLEFQGWSQNFFYYPEGEMSRGSELYRRLAQLPDRKVWQVMEILNGRITKHSFYACRKDRDPSTYRIDFDDDRFPEMVPVISFGWTCTPSAEGTVVLERPQFMNLKIRLRDPLVKVVAFIDGRRTVRECFQAVAASDRAMSAGRGMFRELWRLGYCHFVHRTAVTRKSSSP